MNMNKRRKPLVCVSVVLLLFGSTVFAASTQSPMPTKELRVGMILALTGPGSFWGLAFERGTKYACEEINGAGGIVAGGTRYMIKPLVEDHKYRPEEAIKLTQKFIFTDKVKFLIGPMGAAPTLAVAPICEKNKVFNLATCYGTQVTAPGKNLYTIRFLGFIPELQSGALVSKFRGLFPDLKTIASIYVDDATGQSGNAVTKSNLKAVGYQFIEEVPYPRETREQRPIVTKALSKKPDSLWIMSSPAEDTALVVREARLLGFKGPIWSTGDLSPKSLIDIAGAEAAEGFTDSYFDPLGKGSPPALAKFGKRFIADYGEVAWGASAPVYYQIFYFLKQAIEKTDSVDPTMIRDYFLKPGIELQTLYGPGFIKDRELLRPQIFSMIKGGKSMNFTAYPPGYPESAKR